MADRLVSLGGLVYVENMPKELSLEIPPKYSSFEILDVEFITGKEYDQSKFVCRKTAESLAVKYPDMWKIIRS